MENYPTVISHPAMQTMAERFIGPDIGEMPNTCHLTAALQAMPQEPSCGQVIMGLCPIHFSIGVMSTTQGNTFIPHSAVAERLYGMGISVPCPSHLLVSAQLPNSQVLSIG